MTSIDVEPAPVLAQAAAEPAPEPDPIGAQILDEIAMFLRRFVAYPHAHALIAHALWIAHTHAMEAWESTPRLAFLSPEAGSGKTRALEISALLVPRSIEAVNVTVAYLLRKVSDPEGTPTILYDEIDTVFGPRARENEDIRGILNAGHRRGATAGRCVIIGKTVTTEELPAYCAVAVAGLGGLPDTILTRSVVIKMKRRGRAEHVEAYRRRDHSEVGHLLREALSAWITPRLGLLSTARPKMPPEVTDRTADVWEPLLALADAAGGRWPAAARAAAIAFVQEAQDKAPSFGIRLLDDLRNLFGAMPALATESIITALIKLEEAPWGDMRGKPLDARGLGMMLREYGAKSKTIRFGTMTAKGYERTDLVDAWNRYLPAAGTPEAATSVTGVTTVTV